MIEKIIKVVKSGNKKRGRNITIGAVVGMLLSCTAVMGAATDDTIGLEIKDNGGIKFVDRDGNEFIPGEGGDPYPVNKWNAGTKTYINNSTISDETEIPNVPASTTVQGIGVKISVPEINFVNNGVIKEEITGTTIGDGWGSNAKGYGIYIESDLNGNLINNGKITSTVIFTKVVNSGYGIYIESDLKGNLTNNGEITGTAVFSDQPSYGYGIYIESNLNGNLTNNGKITAVDSFENYGIYIKSSLDGELINNGIINLHGHNINSGIYIKSSLALGGELTNNGIVINTATPNSYTNSSARGIEIISELTGFLTNNGIITSTSTSLATVYSYGIKMGDLTGSLTNNGIITAAGTANTSSPSYKTNVYGICIDSSSSSITSKIANTGIVYGKVNAIKIGSGSLNDLSNYGLLVAGDEVIDGTVTDLKNYGLAFKVDESGKYSATDAGSDSDFSKFGTTDTKDGYTIINAKAKGTGNTDITGTDSLTLEEGTLSYKNSGDTTQKESISSDKKYVLNGIADTLLVAKGDNKLSNSVINAYGTAVKFGTNGGNLTLAGTIVNGGADGSDAIVGSNNSDNLVLQGKSIINGNIVMGAGDDTLTIGSGSVINGTLNGRAKTVFTDYDGIGASLENNTLNFGTADSSSGEETRILHDISGFENININSNITLHEKTTDTDGKDKNLEVTGVENINISAGAVLNLRIDSTKVEGGKYKGHALAGNTGLTIHGDTSLITENTTIEESEDGIYNVGVLNLITNGLAKDSVIDMTGISLDNDLFVKTNSILDKATLSNGDIKVEAGRDLKEIIKDKNEREYIKLNTIYKGIYSSTELNFNTLKDILTLSGAGGSYTSVTDREQIAKLLSYLGSIYTEAPYSYSSELSRRSMGMFRDIVTENQFRPNQDNWLIMGGLTHADGGTKDTYYGRNYHGVDTGTSDTDADMKLTGAYMLAKYGYSENTSLGLTLGGNKSEAEMSMSKVKGNSGYLGAFAENYRGNLTLKAGAGIQYSEYDADRRTIGGYNYSDKYSDMTYDIYLNGRYSHQIGDNLFLEPYATLSYTYVDQDGANEGSKALAIETDSKSFDYTVGKVGVDLKKVIPHEKGKSTLSAGISYTKILDGANEEHITGRFKGGSNFDILVAHKNEHSIGLNAKYALELESGVIFDVKGTYSVERDSHNQSGKNKTKGEWIVGAGLGYKF